MTQAAGRWRNASEAQPRYVASGVEGIDAASGAVRLALEFDQFAVLRPRLGNLRIVGFDRSALFDNPEDPDDDQENATNDHSYIGLHRFILPL